MTITDREIDNAYQELKATWGGVRQDYFSLLYLEHDPDFRLLRDQALRQVAFNGNDYGIDGFHIDAERRNLYLFQFKWSKNPLLFRDSFKRLTEAGMKRVFGRNGPDPTRNSLLNELDLKLRENKSAIDKVFIYFVFDGDVDQADKSATLSALKEDLESKRYLLDEFFGKEVDLAFAFRSSRMGKPVIPQRTHRYTVDLDLTSRLGPTGEQLYIGFLRLIDLTRIYRSMRSRFFERNIRAGLSEKTDPNLAIKSALKGILDGKQNPASFAFHHNGVTLFAEQATHKDDGSWELVEPRLLNGAQSVQTFERFLEQYKDHPKLADGDGPLAQIHVLAKIITNADHEFVTNVTINNNRQNPVTAWDLHANDDIQLGLEDKLRNDGIFYERQRGAFRQISTDDMPDLEDTNKCIELIKLAQTLVAVDGAIDKLSAMTEVAQSERLYRQVFREGLLNADSKKIVLCYKIQGRLNRLLREIVDKGPNTYYYIQPKGRYLVWALLCQGVLNDDRIDIQTERFGKDLTLSAEYLDFLRSLAGNRVRPLIGTVVAQTPRHKQAIQEERYGFLRTKAMYDSCMELAYEKWQWKQLRL